MSSITVVGTLGIDTIETPYGTSDEQPGGSATYLSLSAGLFSPVRLVSIAGDDFFEDVLTLFRSRGVDLRGLEIRPDQPTFRWEGLYEEDLEAQTRDTALNVLENFEPVLPEEYRDSRYLFLANTSPEDQMDVLDQADADAFVAADTMNFWIDSDPEGVRDVLRRVDVFFLNESEARMLTGETNLPLAARQLVEEGPRSVVVKKGSHGALMMEEDREPFILPAVPVTQPQDPTGAGDSFGGGFLGFIASRGDQESRTLREALVVGTVAASFTVEEFGLKGLEKLDPEVFETRLRRFLRHTQLADSPALDLPFSSAFAQEVVQSEGS